MLRKIFAGLQGPLVPGARLPGPRLLGPRLLRGGPLRVQARLAGRGVRGGGPRGARVRRHRGRERASAAGAAVQPRVRPARPVSEHEVSSRRELRNIAALSKTTK